jgi:transposase-like protein
MPYLDYSTDLVQTDWQQCTHVRFHKLGFRSGKQLYQCTVCGKCFVANREKRYHEELVRALAKCWKAGFSQWKARGTCRVNYLMAKKYYRLFEEFNR